jgi:hypothetical protein
MLRKKDIPGIKAVRELGESEESSVHDDESSNKHISTSAKTLDAVVVESIDTVLNQLLARKVTEAIYDYLERNHSLARDELAQNADKLFAVLDGLFGHQGRKVVSRCIAHRLFENLNLTFTAVAGFEFSDYVETARRLLAARLTEKRM